MQSAISTLRIKWNNNSAKVRTTSATSPSGSETSFTTTSSGNAKPFPLEKILNLKHLEWLHHKLMKLMSCLVQNHFC